MARPKRSVGEQVAVMLESWSQEKAHEFAANAVETCKTHADRDYWLAVKKNLFVAPPASTAPPVETPESRLKAFLVDNGVEFVVQDYSPYSGYRFVINPKQPKFDPPVVPAPVVVPESDSSFQ